MNIDVTCPECNSSVLYLGDNTAECYLCDYKGTVVGMLCEWCDNLQLVVSANDTCNNCSDYGFESFDDFDDKE